MHIPLSKEQYRELIKTFLTGNLVRETVAEAKSETSDELRRFEAYLLSFAPDFESGSFAEIEKEELRPSHELEHRCNDILDDYDNEQFWRRLETELGERDAWEASSVEERQAMELAGLWPKRAKGFFDTYHHEFHTYGTDRLRIEGSRPRHTKGPGEKTAKSRRETGEGTNT